MKTCRTCNGQGGHYEGDIHVRTEWKPCLDCAQNQPGTFYQTLDKIGATMEWQRNHMAEVEATIARFAPKLKRNNLNSFIGCQIGLLSDPALAGFRNTIAAGIEMLEDALADVNRKIAEIPPMDPAKMRIHAWEH